MLSMCVDKGKLLLEKFLKLLFVMGLNLFIDDLVSFVRGT